MDDNAVGMEVDPDLAAAMGFSSFGPSKRSRQHVRTEAATEAGTGTNRVELGPRKRQANGDQGATGPRKRRADNDDMDPVNRGATHTSKAPTESNDAETVTALSDMVSVTPPQKQDEPLQSEESIAIQSREPAEKPKSNKETVPTGLAAFLARGRELPQIPSTGISNVAPVSVGADVATTSLPKTFDTRPASSYAEPDLQALKNGFRDENGDIAYFLPSFIEDPWKLLERQAS